MNVSELIKTLDLLKGTNIVPCIVGAHGIGKTSIVSQFANSIGYKLYPILLGQLNDQGDILGLPEIESTELGKMTKFIHPDLLPREENCIIFFDELNRVTDRSLLQGLFQMMLEGRYHNYKVPKNTIIIVGMNPPTDEYNVVDVMTDKAFADRFLHIKFEPSVEDFTAFMDNKYGGNSIISTFIKTQPTLLEENITFSLDYVKPSRRSYDRVQELINKGIPEEIKIPVIGGLIGLESAIALNDFEKTQEKIVTVEELFQQPEKNIPKIVAYHRNSDGSLRVDARMDAISEISNKVNDYIYNKYKSDLLSKEDIITYDKILLSFPKENTYGTLRELFFTDPLIATEGTSLLSQITLKNDKILDILKEAKAIRDSSDSKETDNI